MVAVLFTSGILHYDFSFDRFMLSSHQINKVNFNREYILTAKNNEILLSTAYFSDSCLQGSEQQKLVG